MKTMIHKEKGLTAFVISAFKIVLAVGVANHYLGKDPLPVFSAGIELGRCGHCDNIHGIGVTIGLAGFDFSLTLSFGDIAE